MITKAIALVLILAVVQLAQGIAMRMKLAEPSIVTPVHIALGAITALILIGLTHTSRRQNSPISADITFLLLLFIIQAIAGVFILVNIEAASLVHLVLSFFIVALAASTLVLAASKS